MGSIFSKQHLLDLLKVTEELKIIVVADEVYHGM
jgi:aspartate/methionine/tyrosine aminotransferase